MANQTPPFVDGDLAQANRVNAAWLNDVNDLRYGNSSALRGAALLQFLQEGTGAVVTNVQDDARQRISALQFMSEVERNDVQGFVGASDISTSWLKARDRAYAVAGELINPPGWYNFGAGAAGITLKNSVRYKGAGVDLINGKGTKFIYTGTADAWKISNPLNTSTSAHIDISGIYFYAPNITINNGCLFDTGSSYLTIDRCQFVSGGACIIFDQTELSSVTNCALNAFTVNGACIWLVNGTDKNGAASANFTNKITIANNGFLSDGVGIYDDGGTSHRFIDNNFDRCKYHIIATSVKSLVIEGGEYEVSTEDSIVFGITKRSTAAGNKSYGVRVANLFAYNNIDKPIISTVAGGLADITIDNLVLETVPGRAFSGLELAEKVTALNNRQVGTGDTDTTVIRINNHVDNLATTTSWGASVVAPAIGNGTIAGAYSRRGQRVTYNFVLAFGNTTTLGTGYYTFDLPVAADTTLGMYETGTAWLLVTGTSYYSASVRIENAGTKAVLYLANANAVGAAVPAAWTNTSRIEFSITYTAATSF